MLYDDIIEEYLLHCPMFGQNDWDAHGKPDRRGGLQMDAQFHYYVRCFFAIRSPFGMTLRMGTVTPWQHFGQARVAFL